MLLALFIYWYTQPTEMCFDADSYKDRVQVTLNETIYKSIRPDSYIMPRQFCLAIDTVKHKFCSKDNLSADYNTLCLGWSRQLTAIFTQLTLYTIVELVNIVLLPKSRHPMRVMMVLVVLPILQIALMGTIFSINVGLLFGWSTQWSNANFDPVPSIPLPSYTLVICAVLMTLKMIEATVLGVEYHKSGMNVPVVQSSDQKLK
uniref:Uncharacterized protein n=1 Tax=Panagrellus redivivus TaxID=6233 RepID=A0A7E5A1H8_PANRE